MFNFKAMSIRVKLAAILGVTIFALAGTRALGLSQLGSFLERFKSYTDQLETVQLEIASSHRAELDLFRRAVGRLESLQTEAVALRRSAEELAGKFEALRNEAEAARAVEVAIMNRTYVSMLVLVLGAGILAYILIVAMIARPLARVAEVADAVARGDLRSDVTVESTDELGLVMRSLRDMNHGLGSLIGKVRGVSGIIGEGSARIATVNADFAARMAQQSASLEKTAAAMQALTGGVGRTAEHARRASERASNASEVAVKGGKEVARVAATMLEIDRSAQRITEVIAVIDGIAFQTNLLALNAAVEAAHAGANGRGFAVVAAEVRRLAQRSASAAQEVKNLIEDSLAKVKQGEIAVRSAGGTMSEIVEYAQEFTGIVGEIAQLASGQALGLAEINRTVAEMDQVTRQNADLTDDAAHSAQAMREQAIVLNNAVSVFQFSELRGDTVTSAAVSPANTATLFPTQAARRLTAR